MNLTKQDYLDLLNAQLARIQGNLGRWPWRSVTDAAADIQVMMARAHRLSQLYAQAVAEETLAEAA